MPNMIQKGFVALSEESFKSRESAARRPVRNGSWGTYDILADSIARTTYRYGAKAGAIAGPMRGFLGEANLEHTRRILKDLAVNAKPSSSAQEDPVTPEDIRALGSLNFANGAVTNAAIAMTTLAGFLVSSLVFCPPVACLAWACGLGRSRLDVTLGTVWGKWLQVGDNVAYGMCSLANKEVLLVCAITGTTALLLQGAACATACLAGAVAGTLQGAYNVIQSARYAPLEEPCVSSLAS